MDIFDAFDLSGGAIVAAVGGGGKSGVVFAIADGATGRGLAVLVTSTTRLHVPADREPAPVFECDGGALAEVVALRQSPGRLLIAAAGRDARGLPLGFPAEALGNIAPGEGGIIAIEADGSANLPFKAPAAHEPVIPSTATDVIVCVGLEVLGERLEPGRVHRAELVAEILREPLGAILTADMIVRVVSDIGGGRKGVPPGARIHVLLNNPRFAEHERLGLHIAQRLVYAGFARGVVASPGRGVVHAVVK